MKEAPSADDGGETGKEGKGARHSGGAFHGRLGSLDDLSAFFKSSLETATNTLGSPHPVEAARKLRLRMQVCLGLHQPRMRALAATLRSVPCAASSLTRRAAGNHGGERAPGQDEDG